MTEEEIYSFIERKISEVQFCYHRLIFLINRENIYGEMLNKYTYSRGYDYANVNLVLSERLMRLPLRQRSLQVPGIFTNMINMYDGEVLVLDRIEMLFSPHLHIDPLRLLGANSRNKTLVAVWPGILRDDNLVYAPGHPEYRNYRLNEDFMIAKL